MICLKVARGGRAPQSRNPIIRVTIMRALGWAILASLMLWAGAWPAPAGAVDHVVGVESQSYRPFYWTENGQYHSPAREILDEFARQARINFIYRPLPVNRLYREFLSGQLDFKFPDNPQWKIEEKKGRSIIYSDSVVEYIDGVMVTPQRKGRGVKAIKVLGIILGFTPWDYQDLIQKGQIRLVENGSFEGLLEQAIRGRVDGAYMNPIVARFHLEKAMQKPGALVFDPDLPHTKGSYLVSTIKHPELMVRFNRFLKQNSQKVRAILRRHRAVMDHP